MQTAAKCQKYINNKNLSPLKNFGNFPDLRL